MFDSFAVDDREFVLEEEDNDDEDDDDAFLLIPPPLPFLFPSWLPFLVLLLCIVAADGPSCPSESTLH